MINDLVSICEIADRYLTYLNGKMDFSGNGFPVFTKEMLLDEEPDLIVPFYQRHNRVVKDPAKTVICFYSSDRFLYRRLEKVFDDINEYKQFQGVIGLDITVTEDMDIEWQNMIMLVNQLFLAVLACNDIKVVMNSRIGSPASLSNLNGFPKRSLCATSFLGCNRLSSENDYSFLKKVLALLPSKLLIYGKHDTLAEAQLSRLGIDYRIYADFHRLSKGVA